MKAIDVVNALDMKVKEQFYQSRTIHHSDRGLKYCSEVYQAKLMESNMKPSMTDGYDCYQNALAEQINGILIQELIFI